MDEKKDQSQEQIKQRRQPAGRRKPVHEEPAGRASRPIFIVGIGASAGGLEAFTQVLRNFRDDSGIAMILVQHLGAQHESLLANLLGESTHIPVLQARKGMAIEANHVYVIPPNALMEVQNGQLHLFTCPADHKQFMPVDHFFRSLAEYARDRAIGAILSGTGSDGSNGMRAIKAVGGITTARQIKSEGSSDRWNVLSMIPKDSGSR